ncbi:phospho-N-acetylmuramoyl-pentapeptide-transferase [Arthrobacter sp. UKPF54-2]|uniref:phospho-N-acetylmuramoyl-pentapeptide- transferase n=1 Tax=Arthrobacter sp. UKPF54-2 TaxID=2600159 RepID=UPI0011B172B7|nr:phospho-N-acetylmuramoyl-pentapeptide-transferase [Arthrobacter sp. UKPF54-2]QDY89453.1 phospho-N-acetylmuramoyl-pentapeptide-transferase [Arthrobacter sp. UKPF54-2]
MIALLLAAGLALILALGGTPVLARYLVKKNYGQFIRDDGPTSHHTKRGTPTMGGVWIIGSVVIAYFATHGIMTMLGVASAGPTASGLLLLMVTVGMGLVGFFDDYIKVSKQRSLGLTAPAKIIGQTAVGATFAILALSFPDENGRTPGSTAISFVRDTPFDLAFAGPLIGAILFILWSILMLTGASNGVNITDGLDGLAAGASILVFGAYMLMGIWQFNQRCADPSVPANICYQVRDPLDLALIAAALCGSLVGFLWWNTTPAKIIMGDTGSLALGGAIAGFAILSRTQLLLVIMAGLFVMITLSVIIQVGFFKLSGGKRVFLMTPLHHHFELKGWEQVTVVARFWIIAGLFVAAALGIFYAEWVVLL